MLNPQNTTSSVYQITRSVSLSIQVTNQTSATLTLSGPIPLKARTKTRLKSILPHLLKDIAKRYPHLTIKTYGDYAHAMQQACIALLQSHQHLSTLALHLWSPQSISSEENASFLKAYHAHPSLQFCTHIYIPLYQWSLKKKQAILGAGLNQQQLHIHHTKKQIKRWRDKLKFSLKMSHAHHFFKTKHHITQAEADRDFFGLSEIIAKTAEKIKLSAQEENVFNLFPLDKLRPKPLPPEFARDTQLKIGR